MCMEERLDSIQTWRKVSKTPAEANKRLPTSARANFVPEAITQGLSGGSGAQC